MSLEIKYKLSYQGPLPLSLKMWHTKPQVEVKVTLQHHYQVKKNEITHHPRCTHVLQNFGILNNDLLLGSCKETCLDMLVMDYEQDPLWIQKAVGLMTAV